MNNIGQRIKELRKKNDLTQEKLADYLGVTYQSVSKWETGITYPDLSLIVPLSKMFHVTTDELLGVTPENDYRRTELEESYNQILKLGVENYGVERYNAIQALVREFPDDMNYLNEFAWVESNRSWNFNDPSERTSEQEKAVRHFALVIENCTDKSLRSNAIQGIVQNLCFLGRFEEAKKYAYLLPDSNCLTKDDVIGQCLTGEELVVFKQKRLMGALSNLVSSLIGLANNKKQAYDLAEIIINTFISDGNLGSFYEVLYHIEFMKAELYAAECKDEKAINCLKKAKEYAMLADSMESSKEKIYYSTPFFDRLYEEPAAWDKCEGVVTHTDAFANNIISMGVFSSIRDLDGFKEL